MNEEKLLREFIAALEMLDEVYKAELKKPEDEAVNDEAANCDFICADDIESYHVGNKIIELKKRLWSLPL